MVYRLMALNKPDTATRVWGRVAGDAMDAAMLATSLASGNRHRRRAGAALLLVLGVAALDIAVATALSQREEKALQTARRTHVRRSGTAEA